MIFINLIIWNRRRVPIDKTRDLFSSLLQAVNGLLEDVGCSTGLIPVYCRENHSYSGADLEWGRYNVNNL